MIFTNLSLVPPHYRSCFGKASATLRAGYLLWKERKRTKKESKKNGKRTQLRYGSGGYKAERRAGFNSRRRWYCVKMYIIERRAVVYLFIYFQSVSIVVLGQLDTKKDEKLSIKIKKWRNCSLFIGGRM